MPKRHRSTTARWSKQNIRSARSLISLSPDRAGQAETVLTLLTHVAHRLKGEF
jgi:hypothetical protein